MAKVLCRGDPALGIHSTPRHTPQSNNNWPLRPFCGICKGIAIIAAEPI